MTYTQADADAAKAKIAADNATLATQTQAVSDAQTALANSQTAETMAETQLTAAQDALASAQGAATDAASKLDAANGAAAATKADIVTQQAIIDAFNAQPAPPPPIIVVPPSTDYIVPDLPAFPAGPFTKHATIKVSATNNKINLPDPVEFAGNYICIAHTDKSAVLQQLLIAQALVDAEGGSLFYSGSMCGGLGATIGIVGCKKVRTGRPFLRFCGKWPGLIKVGDLTAIYDTLPNVHEGDIATAAQFGNKAIGEDIESVWIERVLTQGIYDNWGPGKYDNGDTATSERTVRQFRVDHATSLTAPDSCIDSKARHSVYGNLFAKDSRETLKDWDDFTANSIVSINPKVDAGSSGGFSGIRCMGAPSRHFDPSSAAPVGVINQLWHESPTAPAIRIENGPFELHIKQGRSDAPKLVFTTNNGSVHPNSTWNGSAFPKALIQAG